MEHRRMNIGFVGLGKLGKISAETLAEAHDVYGYDKNPSTAWELRNGATRVDSLEECVKGRDVVLVAVQTPHDPKYDGREPTSHLPPKDFDYTHIIEVVKDIEKIVKNTPTIVSVISTMLPGTVRKHIAPLLNNVRFIYNPYLIAQGTVADDMRNPEMIMLGTETGDDKYGDSLFQTMYDLYDPIVADGTRYESGTWEEIEAIKVFYNTFISTKLALVNMIQDVAMKTNYMNAEVVCDALANSTKRIMGPSYMKPGFGDGGGCHPRDNIALRVLNERYDLGYDLFDSIMKAREEQANNMATYCNKFDLDVVICGKSFKPGLEDDPAGSPSMLVGWYIQAQNANRKVYYDEAPDGSQTPYVYLIHDKDLMPKKAHPQSVIVDPNRRWKEDSTTIRVRHYGNTRPDNFSCFEDITKEYE